METLLDNFIVADAPDVTVCRDDAEAERFIMLPHRPAVPRDPSGGFSFHLMEAGSAGALVNLDVELAASNQEEEAIRAALIAGRAPGGAYKEPRLVHPMWREGTVTLQFGSAQDGLLLTATPSLFGRNRASFASLLPMPVWREAVVAVQRGDSPGQVHYRVSLDMRGPPAALHLAAKDTRGDTFDVTCEAAITPGLLAFAREAWRFRAPGARSVDLPAAGPWRLVVDVTATLAELLGTAGLRPVIGAAS